MEKRFYFLIFGIILLVLLTGLYIVHVGVAEQEDSSTLSSGSILGAIGNFFDEIIGDENEEVDLGGDDNLEGGEGIDVEEIGVDDGIDEEEDDMDEEEDRDFGNLGCGFVAEGASCDEFNDLQDCLQDAAEEDCDGEVEMVLCVDEPDAETEDGDSCADITNDGVDNVADCEGGLGIFNIGFFRCVEDEEDAIMEVGDEELNDGLEDIDVGGDDMGDDDLEDGGAIADGDEMDDEGVGLDDEFDAGDGSDVIGDGEDVDDEVEDGMDDELGSGGIGDFIEWIFPWR